jgi:SAM-dependent methyltransferase
MAGYGDVIRETYDKCAAAHHAKLMDPSDSPWNVYERHGMLNSLGDCSGLSVVDLGCGSGIMAGEIAKRNPASFVGIDFSREQVRIAAKENPDARFLVGDAARLPVEDSSFDLALSSYLINNLDSETLARHFSEVGRALKKGGKYHFSTGHPVISGNESVRMGNERGLLVYDYFDRKTFDLQMMSKGKEIFRIDSFYHNFDEITAATKEGGLLIERLLEPRPPEVIRDFDREYFELANKAPTLYIGVAVKA